MAAQTFAIILTFGVRAYIRLHVEILNIVNPHVLLFQEQID